MAAGAWTFYYHARKNIGNAKINLSGKFRMALMLSTSNAATLTLSAYGSLTNQVASGNGYSASQAGGGGKAIASTWLSGASSAIYRFNYSPALVWTGTGGTITGVRFAVIYVSNATTANRKLLCYCALSTVNFNVTIANTLTVTAAATGVFNLA